MELNKYIKKQVKEYNQLSEKEKDKHFVDYIVDIATEIASINDLYNSQEELLSDENRQKAYDKAYELMENNLKVTSVRYFETRRGLGYECTTNVRGLAIWNDGNGSATYLTSSDYDIMKGRDVAKYEEKYNGRELERLINVYNGKSV